MENKQQQLHETNIVIFSINLHYSLITNSVVVKHKPYSAIVKQKVSFSQFDGTQSNLNYLRGLIEQKLDFLIELKNFVKYLCQIEDIQNFDYFVFYFS